MRVRNASNVFSVAMLMLISLSLNVEAAGVKAWSVPKGETDPTKRDTWKPAAKGDAPAGGAALENKFLVVMAQPGAAGIIVCTKNKDGKSTRVDLIFRGKGSVPQTIQKVSIKNMEAGAATLSLTAGSLSAELTLGQRQTYLSAFSLDGKGSLEVRAAASYTVLPDLFGYDLVYDPGHFKGDRIPVPAENMLLNLLEGNRAIVMCIWPGSLKGAKKKSVKAEHAGSRDPAVELLTEKTEAGRRITAAHIEFANGPIYVAIQESEGLWHGENISEFEVQKPTKIEWQRPFDAKWRVSTLVADGKLSKDLMTRSQSYELLVAPSAEYFKKGRPKDPVGRAIYISNQKIWKKGYPVSYEERTYSHIYPAWFKLKETFMAVYTDNPRTVAQKRKSSGKENNIFEKAIFYPLDRNEATPLNFYTSIDLMRQTLGLEACDYILDLEGVKPLRSSGDDRKLVDNATCTIWKNHVNGILQLQRKGKKITEKHTEHLIRSIQDALIFLHAVHDRIKEYQTFNDEFLAFVKEASKDKAVHTVATRVAGISEGMVAMLKKNSLEKYKKSLDSLDTRTTDIIPELKATNFEKAQKLGQGYRGLGQAQDNAVSDCRRYVKAIRHEVSFIEGSTAEVQKFVAEVRDRCAKILRRAHPKELLHSDASAPRAHPERDPDFKK